MSTASIGDFFVKLGFKTDNKPLKSFQSSLSNLRKNVALIGVATAGATAGLNKMLQGTIETSKAYNAFNQNTGLSVEKLQEFENGALRLTESLSSDQIQKSIASLQKNLTNLKLGKGDLTPFQQLNINPLQDAFGVIEDVRESIKGLDDSTASNLLEKIGLQGFLPALRASQEEFSKLSKGVFISDEQRNSIKQLNLSLRNVSLTMKQLKDQAIAKLAPELSNVVNDFFKWINENSNKITSSIASITKGFAHFLRAVGNSVGLITDFVDKITGTQHGLKILTGIVTGLALSFAPVIGAISAVIALFDDIQVWKNGGESLFGGFYNTLSKVWNVIKKITTGIKELIELISSITSGAFSSVGDKFNGLFGKKDKNNTASKNIRQIQGELPMNLLPSTLEDTRGKIINSQDSTTNNNKNTNNTFNISMQATTDKPQDLMNGFLDQLKQADISF